MDWGSQTELGGYSARAVDPSEHQPVAKLVVGGRRRGWVFAESLDHLAPTAQILFGGGGPVNFGMEQRAQTLPVSTLDCIQHIAHRWNLISHSWNVRPLHLSHGGGQARAADA